jgi:hypothetical protein
VGDPEQRGARTLAAARGDQGAAGGDDAGERRSTRWKDWSASRRWTLASFAATFACAAPTLASRAPMFACIAATLACETAVAARAAASAVRFSSAS